MKQDTKPREEKDQYKYRYQGEQTKQMPNTKNKVSQNFLLTIIYFGIFGWLGSYFLIPFFWILFDNILTGRIIMTVIFFIFGILHGCNQHQKSDIYGVDGYWRTSKNGNVHWVNGHIRRR